MVVETGRDERLDASPEGIYNFGVKRAHYLGGLHLVVGGWVSTPSLSGPPPRPVESLWIRSLDGHPNRLSSRGLLSEFTSPASGTSSRTFGCWPRRELPPTSGPGRALRNAPSPSGASVAVGYLEHDARPAPVQSSGAEWPAVSVEQGARVEGVDIAGPGQRQGHLQFTSHRAQHVDYSLAPAGGHRPRPRAADQARPARPARSA